MVIRFLKRYFPNAPDWLLGGSFTTLLLWFIILPAQFIEIIIQHEYIPVSLWDWSTKFFYVWGYFMALFVAGHLANFTYASGPWLHFFVEFLGLIIVSPVYFFIGSSFATRDEHKIVGAVVLAQVHFLISSCMTAWLIWILLGD